jgi:hypothetical protein
MESKRPTITIILTLLAFAFPLYTQVVWALVAGSSSFDNSIEMFLRHFPSSLSIATITYLTLALSIVSAILAEVWRRNDTHLGKTIAFIILILSIVIVALTLFQLM